MASPKLLTAEQLYAVDDRPSKIVKVPGWGKVKIRALTVGAREDAISRARGEDGELDSAALNVWLTIRALEEPALGDDAFEAIKAKSAESIDFVIVELYKLIGGSAADIDAAEKTALDE